eukprot:9499061-Pyramimonas_sp.AAC.1
MSISNTDSLHPLRRPRGSRTFAEVQQGERGLVPVLAWNNGRNARRTQLARGEWCDASRCEALNGVGSDTTCVALMPLGFDPVAPRQIALDILSCAQFTMIA